MGKKFYSLMPFILDPGKKIPIKIVKKLKKLKNRFPTFFLAKKGWDRPRKREKKFSPEFRWYSTWARILQKNTKKFKKLKNLFLELFIAKTWWDRPRKGEKNFCPEFCSYPTRARKFQKNRKKNQKIKKSLFRIISSRNGSR